MNITIVFLTLRIFGDGMDLKIIYNIFLQTIFKNNIRYLLVNNASVLCLETFLTHDFILIEIKDAKNLKY